MSHEHIMPKFTKALFPLLFSLPLWRAASATCYFPNGAVAKNDTACTKATVSTCCQAGATCLDNGLCFDPFGSAVGGYIRWSCTDKTWASADCPQYCTTDDATSGLFNSLSDAGVVSCGNNGFCCQSDAVALCNCQTGDGTFTLSGDLKPFTTIASSSSTVASAKTASTTTSSRSSSSLSQTTSTSSSASSFSSPTNTSPPAPSNNTAVKVGLGVGIPLGCALVGVLGVMAYLVRRRQQQQKAAEDPDPSTVQFIPPTAPTEYKPEGIELNEVHEAPGSETFLAPQRAQTQIYEAPGTEVYRDDHEMPV